jgi:hypothetical protein
MQESAWAGSCFFCLFGAEQKSRMHLGVGVVFGPVYSKSSGVGFC